MSKTLNPHILCDNRHYCMEEPMRFKSRFSVYCLSFVFFAGLVSASACAPKQSPKLQFELSFPASVHGDAITGRVFIMVTENEKREPRLQAGSWMRSVPFSPARARSAERTAWAVPSCSRWVQNSTCGRPRLRSADSIASRTSSA